MPTWIPSGTFAAEHRLIHVSDDDVVLFLVVLDKGHCLPSMAGERTPRFLAEVQIVNAVRTIIVPVSYTHLTLPTIYSV